MRQLWSGDTVDYQGAFYTIENARLFSAPAVMPNVIWAAGGESSAALAGKHADGLWATSPSAKTVQAYRDAGGNGDIVGQLTLCFDNDRERAISRALEIWPNAAIPGQLSQDLPTFTHFEQAAELVTRGAIADQVVCGNSVAAVVEAVQGYADAGFTMLHFHQIGPDQNAFLDWWRDELFDAVAAIGDRQARHSVAH